MPWYTGSCVIHQHSGGTVSDEFQSREYWYLLMATDADTAYAKSLILAQEIVKGPLGEGEGVWDVDGVSELLLVGEAPSDGSELTWLQQEILPNELDSYTRPKEELRIFNISDRSSKASGWYVSELVLTEIHDTGSHGDSILVWTNSHLIKAADAESAYKAAVDLGMKQASESGSHRCDGDVAHWQFIGLRGLVETIDAPRDGALLWFEEFTAGSGKLAQLVPPRQNLSVFEWEARQGRG
jgi:hypothetical protein